MLEFGGENLEIKEKNYPGPFLLSLSDDENLTLRVVISFREDADTDLVYEIVFEHYILYQILDVISVKPPAVRKITGSEVNKNSGDMG